MVVGARFTPSLLDAGTLERLFVNRHHHLDDAMGRIERAAVSGERAAKLFVGPRGAGKTHLLSLVYHRAKALPGFGTAFQLAWLPEDLWTIGSLDDLLAEIVTALEPGGGIASGEPWEAILEATRRRGPIVVLIENLDAVLEAIGSDGQRRLRAFLENARPFLLIATATRLGDELLEQAEPFYGFFDTSDLEPFDVDGAARMLKRIAEVNGDVELAAELDEPRALNRLATIEHLAGGQPRVWALLAAGLTVEGLDDLVSTLVERFDDLTPYYQQQLDRLSLNERRTVRSLAAADGAVTVKELAERTGIDARSLAKTITDLRRRGWVARRTGPLADLADQRLSYYQLAEPLARLAFQLKEARGRPVGLVVEFLKAWFDHAALSADGEPNPTVAMYRQEAHQSLLADAPMVIAKALCERGDGPAVAWATDPTIGLFHPDPHAGIDEAVGALLVDLDDAIAAYQAGDPEPLLRQPPALSSLLERRLDHQRAAARRLQLAFLGFDGGRAAEWIPRLEGLHPAVTGTDAAEATALLALQHLRLSNEGPADVLLERLGEGASTETAPLLLWTGKKLLEARQADRARVVLELAQPVTPVTRKLELALALEAAYQRSGRAGSVVDVWEHCASVLTAALGADHPSTLTCRNYLATAYRSAGNLVRAIPAYEATLADRERVLGTDHPATLASRNNLASAYESAGDLGRAIPMCEATLADCERVLGADHPTTLASRNNLASAYESAGDLGRAIPMHEATLADCKRVLGTEHPSTLASRNNLASAYQAVGDLRRAIPMHEATLEDCERVLGTEHPSTLVSRNNLAYAYQAVGDLGRAIPLYEATLADCERVLGADHPDTLTSRNNLASAYELAGDLGRAIPMYEATLADCERVLGADHPDTRATRECVARARAAAAKA